MNTEARKETVDQRVALALNLPIDTVRLITRCFLRECAECLAEYGLLVFTGFGRLKVSVRPTNQQRIVRFRQADDLRKALRNHSKETANGQIWSGRVDNPGAGEAGDRGVPRVREET